jgi:hypothetical protein
MGGKSQRSFCQRFTLQIKEEHMAQLVPLLTTEPPLSCRTASEASRCSPRIHASVVRIVTFSSPHSVVLNICYEKDNVHMVCARALESVLRGVSHAPQVLAAGAAPPLIAFLGKTVFHISRE